MTAKLDYQWRLREVMATRGMFSTTDLGPRLAERDIELSSSQIYRLVVERPERLSLKVLMALLDILDCRMEDLIQPVAARRAGRRTGTDDEPSGPADGSPRSGVGEFRPKRARITRRDP